MVKDNININYKNKKNKAILIICCRVHSMYSSPEEDSSSQGM